MFRTRLFLTTILVVLISSNLLSQDLDKGYISAFGWGTAAVAQNGAPAFAQYEPALFKFRDGKFFITAGENQDLHCRFLVKDGKTYGQHFTALKKSTGKKTATLKREYLRTLFYVSHDENGSQLYTQWPSSPSAVPEWKEIAESESNLAPASDWVTSRFSMMEERANMTALISWMAKARPGWKIYVLHVAGYTREAPELKYYDKSELRWMVPLEYVDTQPLAVATIEVEKSTNPLLAWSFAIETMPAEQKGVKDGVMSILKDGNKVTTFKFGIEYKYLNQVTNLHNFYVHYEYENGQVIGGFYAGDVSSINTGIQNTFYEAIGKALFEEKLH
ncbi:MAG: hypothetical protein WBQ23_06525 [Bacteroidota bacterium]